MGIVCGEAHVFISGHAHKAAAVPGARSRERRRGQYLVRTRGLLQGVGVRRDVSNVSGTIVKDVVR